MIQAEQYLKEWGINGAKIEPITGSGSNRFYYRLRHHNKSYIGVVGEIKEENEAFLYMAQHFRINGLPIPRLYNVSNDRMSYLQEDLGDVSLYDKLMEYPLKERFNCVNIKLVMRTLAALAKLQHIGDATFDYSRCFPESQFSRHTIFWDLNYFKYYFLKPSGAKFNEEALELEFESLADALLDHPVEGFMFRDFQSRNVMLKNGEKPYFIDFQGGRRGPILYDVVSFLWQAKAEFPENLKMDLVHFYLKEVKKYREESPMPTPESLHRIVLLRLLQVLGAYGYRGNFEKKQRFINSIPFAIVAMRNLFATSQLNYPVLQRFFEEIDL